MTFTVEDETGLSDANAYVTVEEFKAYHDDRGFDYSSYSDALIQVAIVKATDYIENRYRKRFIGAREFEGQALSFPRLKLYDEDGELVTGLPNRLKYATSEYAKRALTAELAPDPTVDDRGTAVTSHREKVGPIETETSYLGGSVEIYRPYPAADALLSEYVTPSGSVSRA